MNPEHCTYKTTLPETLVHLKTECTRDDSRHPELGNSKVTKKVYNIDVSKKDIIRRRK